MNTRSLTVDMDYVVDTMRRFIETPSPVGYYKEIKPLIEEYAKKYGYEVTYENRNTAYITVKGEDESKTVVYDEVFEGDGLRYEISSFLEGTGADANRSKAMAGMMERFLGLRTAG